MTSARRYSSPKREAQAAATRAAILDAFAEQLSEPGRDRLSPSEAAARAGVSLRTVHAHFPNEESQIAALGEWLDRKIYPQGVQLATGPDDLPRYYRHIHTMALKHPMTRALASGRGGAWQEVRIARRAKRLEAIRAAVKAVGAPPKATADATAMLLSLSGADASWPLHDHGLPLERIPDVIADTVELIVAKLRTQVKTPSRKK
ncbi:MAG: TetR/AcrR family transcriptional regulator [Alphaproteobacteria bacterium]|nr:TetR/AcrR family transcriptional regulator [Alphaproteobacteria bacterium]